MEPGTLVSDHVAPQTVSLLSFVQWLAPGGICHLRKIGGVKGGCSGVIDRWRQGSRSIDCRVNVSEEHRHDVRWRRGASESFSATAAVAVYQHCLSKTILLGVLRRDKYGLLTVNHYLVLFLSPKRIFICVFPLPFQRSCILF